VSILWIGARHLHIPVVSLLPFFHAFLLLDVEDGLRTFSGDRGQGMPAPLQVYEARYTRSHPDFCNVVALQVIGVEVDANTMLASFRSSLKRIGERRLTYNLLTCNCNMVVTTLMMNAGLEVPPPPAVFLPGYGRSIL